MRFTLVISLLLAILAVVFALQNPQPAQVQLFGTELGGSTALVLIVTFAIGVLVGLLGAVPGWIRNRRKVSSLQKTIAEREDQVRRERDTAHQERAPTQQQTQSPPSSSESAETPTPKESERRSSSGSSSASA